MRNVLISALILTPLFSSCVAAALGIGAGVIISQEMLDNESYVVRLHEDVDRVWSVTKQTLSNTSTELIEVLEEMRTVKANVDGAKVTASVEAYDIDVTLLRVSATRYGVANGELAELMTRKILRQLE